MPRRIVNWWHSPAGGREVLVIALPLVISTASWTVMFFIDRMFLLWHTTESLAAALPAALVSFTTVCFPLGVAAYANTFVSQYYGAGHNERIGLAVWQGMFLGAMTIPIALATIPLAPYVFSWAGHDPAVQPLQVIYFQVLAVGAGAHVISTAQSAFFTGRGDVRTVMMVDISAACVNIVLDYAWIFGNWGFDEMGIAGAGWATVCSQWFRVVAYMLIILRPRFREQFQTAAGFRFDVPLFRRLIRFGTPNGCQFLFEIGWFTIFLLIVGRLGPLKLTATNLALNVNSLAFMPVFGFGLATTTLVGQRLGRNEPDLAARSAYSAFALAMVYMVSIATLYVAAPDFILMGHAAGTDPAAFRELRNLTVILLRFVAAYCVFDTLNIVFVSAIKGAGDMRFILKTMIWMSIVPVVATWLGIEVFGLGLYWAWTVVMLYVFLLGIIFYARFYQGKWRDMRVIEEEYLSGIHLGEESSEVAVAFAPVNLPNEQMPDASTPLVEDNPTGETANAVAPGGSDG